jgi:hypothetical protein
MRRSGFKRPTLERKPVALTPVPAHLRRSARMGPAVLVAEPKTAREENPAYRALARGRPCQLRVPGECSSDPATTVLAHSNWHDKAGARKASDQYAVFACYACHTWLDQGRATGAEKQAAFAAGLGRMIRALEAIAATGKAHERAAAQWALHRLLAAGVEPPG